MVLVAVLAVAGCSNASGRAPYLTQPAVACPTVDRLAGQRSADPLPADFRPVAAVRCTFRLTVAQSAGPPSSGLTWAAAQRATGPFDDLVRALRLPPPETTGDLVCPAVFVMPVLLALTDASGNTVLPALPGTVCRTPLTEVQSALDALPWVEIDRQR
ncbi:hypothetical protein [Plantactinospora sp. KLBMP9567]|uniref:hypothetical protein n=1 Tax=Plantactinospora sp. KLBMP9567 TaxID=3085900 RepID=UPI0029823D2C|nr:hypothetical protein [Plantactinospora sp. KLBMP9567]MDW5328303.1 hypothetical protein [Plantactinospora sp. KLBMP9567]